MHRTAGDTSTNSRLWTRRPTKRPRLARRRAARLAQAILPIGQGADDATQRLGDHGDDHRHVNRAEPEIADPRPVPKDARQDQQHSPQDEGDDEEVQHRNHIGQQTVEVHSAARAELPLPSTRPTRMMVDHRRRPGKGIGFGWDRLATCPTATPDGSPPPARSAGIAAGRRPFPAFAEAGPCRRGGNASRRRCPVPRPLSKVGGA